MKKKLLLSDRLEVRGAQAAQMFFYLLINNWWILGLGLSAGPEAEQKNSEKVIGPNTEPHSHLFQKSPNPLHSTFKCLNPLSTAERTSPALWTS